MRSPASDQSTKKANGAARSVKGKTRNGKLPAGSSADDRAAKIEALIERKRWPDAQAALHDALIFHPADHWLWMHLGLCYYEQQEYEKAMKCGEHALQLAPDCPLAMWHYAGALEMAGRPAAALGMWNALLAMDVEAVAHGPHGEGMDWALQLINDVHYRMGGCYQHLGEPELARRSYAKYLHNREHGVASLYDGHEAEQFLKREEPITT